MSELIIQPTVIEAIKPHPNADRLEIAVIGGWENLQSVCAEVGLPTVPVLDYGIFTFEQLVEFAQGNTTMDDEHVREGIVVRPRFKELTWNNSRMIFKLISDGYMLRKGGSEMH